MDVADLPVSTLCQRWCVLLSFGERLILLRLTPTYTVSSLVFLPSVRCTFTDFSELATYKTCVGDLHVWVEPKPQSKKIRLFYSVSELRNRKHVI